MNGNIKVFLVAILFLGLISLACGPSSMAPPAASRTPVLTPGVLQCADILRAKEGQTDSQWEEYTQSVLGKEVYFSGEVDHIFSMTNHVGLVYDNTCGTELYNIPDEKLNNISEGQHLEGYGTIKDVSNFADLVRLKINVNPDLLIIR
jgi:hypothetical protein